jgi:Na+/H+ antiporter NhaD/arsenite permease-like protein
MLDGAAMGWTWALPFVGMLLSIAAGPLLFPTIWHHHYGKIAAGWALLALGPIALIHGAHSAVAALLHTVLAEYLSFMLLLFALYVVAGGIRISGDLPGTLFVNTIILGFGTLIASLVGTTGAAMILVRPLIKANAARTHNAHVMIFFIILVANVGGALTPLGDPPLLVGFLRGVDFFWTAQHVWLQTLIVGLSVLTIFVVVDWALQRRERHVSNRDRPQAIDIRIYGWINFALIALVIGAIFGSAAWKPGVSFDVIGTQLGLQNLLRDAALIVIALVSLWLTPDEHRKANGFSWQPITEVAKLFAGIFITLIPLVAMLAAGKDGLFAGLLSAITLRDGAPNEVAYFWLTGILSAFLDNAPTYLVFFELAGGDAAKLMGPLAGTLAAIAMGAVYMGALSYIGNAPNLMIYAIATERGIRMPTFIGYMLWAAALLIPLFALLTILPIAPQLKWS